MVPRRILPVVVIGQLLALGLWFSGTAAFPGVPGITIAVQAGFVAGTLAFAFLNMADRWPAHRVLCASAIAGAAANAALLAAPPAGVLPLRFATGFAIAGVYPVGMKLLATWYERLGLALGILVAALTLGSGSPYLVRAMGLPGATVVLSASALAVAGGVLVALFAHAGPLLPARSRFEPRAFARAFRVPAFRSSALAYFGHMWELYAFWGLAPLFLAARGDLAPASAAGLVFLAFLAGALGCVAGGAWSRRVGEATVARVALAVSCACCLLSPLAFVAPLALFVPFLILWGASVVADSAQFSAISARAAPREFVGTALTMQNAIGFAVTFGSLALVPGLAGAFGWKWAFFVLALGPVLGLVALRANGPTGQRADGKGEGTTE